MALKKKHRKSPPRYRDIATELQKQIRDLPGTASKPTFFGNVRKMLFTPIKVR